MQYTIDIAQGSFSRRGSYMAIKAIEGPRRAWYLRSLHGVSAQREVLRLVPLAADGTPIRDGREEACPWKLTLCSGLEAVVAGDDQLRIRSHGAGLQLVSCPPAPGSYLARTFVRLDACTWRYIDTVSHTTFLLRADVPIQVESDWDGHNATQGSFALAPGDWELQVFDLPRSQMPGADDRDFGACVWESQADFGAYLAHTPPCPEALRPTWYRAAYTNWSCIVSPRGHMKRAGMYMSNNHMVHIWSWDHCFNALALYMNPESAYDQLACMFDVQDASGCLPDSFDDDVLNWDFCKPPIHGWTVLQLLERGCFTRAMAEDFYPKLVRWTQWWFANRDSDKDGICEYFHGNDSGWDNATLFLGQPPLELPDLSAFLVLQTEALGALARLLEKMEEAAHWQSVSAHLLEKLLEHFWRDGRMMALESGTHREIRERSLLGYLPLLLGEKLPQEVRETMLAQLKANGSLTDWGLATEPADSPYYHADGYWRGPIWAPSTYLMFCALLANGEAATARFLAERFCTMCDTAGFAENFDALTGEGRRDRAYTWTSSVFLLLAAWLKEQEG